MQIIAAVSSPVEGMVYINGRFAGETGPDSPLILPINPHGTLYLELRPFARRWRAGSHRFRFTGGEFETESASDACYIMLWPGGVCEIALTPLAALPQESEFTAIDGVPVALIRGEASLLRVGQSAVALPDGAALPHTHLTLNGAELYIGAAGEETYLAAFASANLRPVDAVVAGRIERDEGDIFRAFTVLNDTAGHARMDVYAPSAEALRLTASEYMWAEGAPRWPQTAADTALAALEAGFLGLSAEADGYLVHQLRGQNTVENVISGYETAMPLQYAAPNALPGVGLVRRVAPRVARVDALRFHAVPGGGPQGPWLVESMQLSDE